jgi:hypothetical protein
MHGWSVDATTLGDAKLARICICLPDHVPLDEPALTFTDLDRSLKGHPGMGFLWIRR